MINFNGLQVPKIAIFALSTGEIREDGLNHLTGLHRNTGFRTQLRNLFFSVFLDIAADNRSFPIPRFSDTAKQSKPLFSTQPRVAQPPSMGSSQNLPERAR